MHDIIFLCVIVADSTCDITIDPDNTNQYIVWGIGGLGETAFKHFDRADGRFYSFVYIVVVEESYIWSVVITVVCMWEFYSNCWQRTHNYVLSFIWIYSSTADDDPIYFGRAAQDQCSGVELVCGGCMPFENESIIARENTTFQARIGPSGNERGYMGITGTIFMYFMKIVLLVIIT